MVSFSEQELIGRYPMQRRSCCSQSRTPPPLSKGIADQEFDVQGGALRTGRLLLTGSGRRWRSSSAIPLAHRKREAVSRSAARAEGGRQEQRAGESVPRRRAGPFWLSPPLFQPAPAGSRRRKGSAPIPRGPAAGKSRKGDATRTL